MTAMTSSCSRGRALAAIVVAGLALALAACGSSSPGVAHLPGHHSTSSGAGSAGSGGSASGGASSGGPSGGSHAEIKMVGVSGQNALRFAQCMRTHGIPSFPDPNAQGVFSFSGSNLGPGSLQFHRAQLACSTLLHLGGGPPSPAGRAAMLAKLLRYSQCMRSHGELKFPDPSSSGGTVRLQLSGVDPSSTIFQRAQSACNGLLPGGGPP